jgi:hypothetical protein
MVEPESQRLRRNSELGDALLALLAIDLCIDS